MAGALSGLVGGILGVDNPSTVPYDSAAEEARRQRQIYGAREAGNYAAESALAGNLGRTINGTAGPSVAQTQLRAGLDQSNADMLAAGAGSSGVNSVLARYQARQMAGEQAARMQQAAALLRAQEVAQAQQQLAALRAAMGNQTIQLYGGNANVGLGYDQLRAQLEQQNTQRDTVLGAAGLSGASQGLGYLTSSFGGSSGQQGS